MVVERDFADRPHKGGVYYRQIKESVQLGRQRATATGETRYTMVAFSKRGIQGRD